jgi:hypothetical protein
MQKECIDELLCSVQGKSMQSEKIVRKSIKKARFRCIAKTEAGAGEAVPGPGLQEVPMLQQHRHL